MTTPIYFSPQALLGGFFFGAGEIRVISGSGNPAGAPKWHKRARTNLPAQSSPHNPARGLGLGIGDWVLHILSYSFILGVAKNNDPYNLSY